ncbi:hypothetical protein PQX77_009817 [Marasmius sp. AFHP31]|nr:hypothetical protein PQX77_009817 [Marasmius sp. AFHP31]
MDIKKGSVLGIYTGKVILRGDAELLKGDKKNYCFDMDGDEDRENLDAPSGPLFTVDARTAGNWTLIPALQISKFILLAGSPFPM